MANTVPGVDALAAQNCAARSNAGVPMNSYDLLSRRQVIITMSGVLMAMFLSALDQTVVSTALPRIVADLGGFDRYTWVSTSYLVASTSVLPIVGRLTDIYGRKWFILAAIVVFLVGSVLAGLSQTMTQLIVFRAIQGLGGGSIMAIAFVAVGDLFPPAERGKNQGYVASVYALSSILGPILGGLITDQLSWNWIFYINLPLGIPLIVLFIFYFPQVKPEAVRHKLDILGVATLILSVVPLMLALSWGGVQYSWGSPQVAGFLVLSLVMTLLFIFIETKAEQPIVPLHLFKNRVLSSSLITVFFTGFAMFGGIIFVPLYAQGVLGQSATSTGTIMTPMMLGMVVGATLSGQALSRLGGHYRTQGLVGLGILVVGLFLISRMTAETSFPVALFNLVIMGFGLGTTFPTYTIAIQNSVSHRFMGVATSAAQFFRSVGGLLGLAVLGSVLTNRFSSNFMGSVSPEVERVLTTDRLNALARNPQELVNAEAQAGLRQVFADAGPQGVGLLEPLLETLRSSLSAAISDVFSISVVVIIIAIVATLFLKEVPLRGRRSSKVETEEADGEQAVAD